MKKNYDLIIIGGGIIGSSIAYQQSKAGKSVLILEKNELGSEASSAAAGMLGAQAEIDENEAMLKLAMISRRMFPSLIQELEELSGIQIGLVNKGMLKVARSPQDSQMLKKQVEFHCKWDPAVRWLDKEELLIQESALSHEMQGGMYIPNDGQLMAPSLSQAFAKGALAKGAAAIEYCEVESLLMKSQSISGVETSQGRFYASTVALTTGAWAPKLLKQTGISLDIFPVKGECLSVIPSRPLINSTIFSEQGCYLVPKKDGSIIIGATSYKNNYDKSVSLKGIASLSEKALSLIPQLQHARWGKAWSGIRPKTGDGLPYIGEHPSCQGLFIAAGHYRNGILLSPVTGKMVSDMIEKQVTEEERNLYDSFKVDRKSNKIAAP